MRRRHSIRGGLFAAALFTAALFATLAAIAGPAAAVSDPTATSWQPNLRIGPVTFNQPLPEAIHVLRRGAGGLFVGRSAGSDAVIRGYLFADPNTGARGARSIWTESRLISYRGVSVGVHWRTAKRRLGRRWRVVTSGRCKALNSSVIQDETTGPVSTQLFFSARTGRISRIALNEITEFNLLCP